MSNPKTYETASVSPPATHTTRDTSEYPALPGPPRPSEDLGTNVPKTLPDEGLSEFSEEAEIDIFTLTPVAALKMLCSSVEDLIRITGNVPPTQPVSLPDTPKVLTVKKEKENTGAWGEIKWGYASSERMKHSGGAVDTDGVPMRRTLTGGHEAGPTEPFHIVGSNSEPLYAQHGAITRKFYSKKPPPISLEEYLLRLHLYCPMSTAVYLATGYYIHKLAVVERIIPVTIRNAHRLLLAGLRIAMKALEDLSYPHRRFAKVGGVSEPELGRLEVSFCFLTNFELKVDKEMLYRHAILVRDRARIEALPPSFTPMLPIVESKHKALIPSNVYV